MNPPRAGRARGRPPGAALRPKTRDHTRSPLAPHGERLRIRIYSDLHLEFTPFEPPENDADAIVLAGDIANGAAGIACARETFGGPVPFLPGKHEYFEGEVQAVQEAIATAARQAPRGRPERTAT